jgi:hypothetical protein
VVGLLSASELSVRAATVVYPNQDKVSPGFAGFMVMFLLAVATVLLIRSMVKHMRKVRYLPLPDDGQDGQPDPGSDIDRG